MKLRNADVLDIIVKDQVDEFIDLIDNHYDELINIYGFNEYKTFVHLMFNVVYYSSINIFRYIVDANRFDLSYEDNFIIRHCAYNAEKEMLEILLANKDLDFTVRRNSPILHVLLSNYVNSDYSMKELYEGIIGMLLSDIRILKTVDDRACRSYLVMNTLDRLYGLKTVEEVKQYVSVL